MPGLRVVPLSGLPTERLERLARRVFGDGDRPPGWLARKLAREAVDPRLSSLALAGDATDTEHVPEDSRAAPRPRVARTARRDAPEHVPEDSLAAPRPRAARTARRDALEHVPEDSRAAPRPRVARTARRDALEHVPEDSLDALEHVPEDSLAAPRPRAARGDLEHVPEDTLVGYLLVGREPGDPIAHSAGIGLVPAARGRGLGAALLSAAGAALRDAGFTALRVLAERERERWYARQGFAVVGRRVTLLAFGTGTESPVPGDIQPWSPDPAAVELCAWRPGPWQRTPADVAATVDLGAGALAHVSREGAALLVHRLTTSPGADPCAAVTALLRRVDRGVPVLLYGCDAVSSITASLERMGLTAAQRFAVMDLPLAAKLYIPRDDDA